MLAMLARCALAAFFFAFFDFVRRHRTGARASDGR